MDERTLVAGYRRLLARLYSPEGYYTRCARHLDAVPIRRGSVEHSVKNGTLGALRRAIWRLGIVGARRRLFWRLVVRGLRRGTDLLPRAVTFATRADLAAFLGGKAARHRGASPLPALARTARG